MKVSAVTWLLAGSLLVGSTNPVRASEVGDAMAATEAGHRAARESQKRIDRIVREIRELRAQQQDVRGRALQASVYAVQLEQQAAAEEESRSALEAQIAGIHDTEAGLLPLARQMVVDLENFVANDLPFQVERRQQRVAELNGLLDDPERNTADKFRRVLDVYRSEVDLGYSLGAEETEITIEGRRTPVAIVRIGRVGLYYLSADGRRAGYWNRQKQGWRPLDDDAIPEVKRALGVARGEVPPELLVLPVRAP